MTVITRPPAEFDPFGPAYRGWDRYAILSSLLENDPPIAVDSLGRTWLFRYDDVFEALVKSEELAAQETSMALALGFEEGCPYHKMQQHFMNAQNPPKHTRLRKAHSYFGKHQLKPLEPSVRSACNTLIDDFPQDGVIDFSAEFAFKLPVGVIMRILNLPVADEPLIREWSPLLFPAGVGPEIIAATNEANAGFRAYVEAVMDERRKQPLEDDIISDLVALERRGELSNDEIWANIEGFIVAGHETTTASLTLGLYNLLRHRDQLDMMREDRSLIANAANEILRYDPPLDAVPRRVEKRLELHGIALEPGALVYVNFAAANRDPRKFPDPDRFDIQRENALRHLTFGSGIHRCLGASLAMLEIQLAFETLLDRLETIELAGEPKLNLDRLFRVFEPLPVRVTRRDDAHARG